MDALPIAGDLWYELMEHYGGLYLTAQGVEISCFPDGSLLLDCEFPAAYKSEGQVSIGLCREYINNDEFTSVLGIQTLAELNELQPEQLRGQYPKNEICIFCCFDEHSYVWDLHFSEENGVTTIIDSNREEVIASFRKVFSVEDIIQYTKEYANSRSPRLIDILAHKLHTGKQTPS